MSKVQIFLLDVELVGFVVKTLSWLTVLLCVSWYVSLFKTNAH